MTVICENDFRPVILYGLRKNLEALIMKIAEFYNDNYYHFKLTILQTIIAIIIWIISSKNGWWPSGENQVT